MKAVGKPQNPKSRSIAVATAPGGNRKRKMGASPPTTVELRGLSVHFPFKPYDCQKDYMEKVLDALLQKKNALLESPTGTGKTLCLLCATLAWQRSQRNISGELSQQQQQQQQHQKSTEGNSLLNPPQNASKRISTIIYASRTHSQLSQVVRELRNTRYRPRHAVLGSRDQMCVHPKVKKATATSADINHDCNALGKERKCQFRNKLDNFEGPPNHECETMPQKDKTQVVLDMEDLVQMGKDHRVCPFYYTRSLLSEAELVLMPYNYLFDKDSRDTTLKDINWKDAVVIFDEAHNLESFATESASFDLTQTDIAICLAEINRACNYVQMAGGGDEDAFPVKADNLLRMKAMFLNFEEYVNNLEASGAFSGEYMMEIFTRGMGINYTNYQLFVQECRKVNELLLDARGGIGGAANKGAPKLEHFVQCIKRVFGESTEGRCFAKAKSYRVHISNAEKNGAGQNGARNNAAATRTISYWCFAPALAMQELESLDIRSILVTSGTLSPLPSYSMELGIPFPHTLENPHIISSDQIHVRVIGKGVSGKQLTSSFQRRQDTEYFIELGNTLVSLAKVIPGGMLIFFPSYGVMETCIERWGGPTSSSSRYNNNNNEKKGHKFFAARKGKGKNTSNQQYSFPFTASSLYGSTFSASGTNHSTPWKRLLGAKSVVLEPRSTADLADAISEFHRYLDMPKSKGCALMGVCRGKISEGIDFSNNMSRAVVITGLPFPPAFDPKVKLKREYLDKARASSNMKSKEEGGFGGAKSEETSSEKGAAGNANNTLSGHEWYSQQAHRAVNQAIGRVIRNRSDYGAVLLLDSRYSQPANHQGLSKWVRPHLLPDQGMGVAIGALSKFYKQAEAKSKENEQASIGIILEYEQEEEEQERLRKQKQQRQLEEEENAFTKVAFVQNLTRGLNQAKAGLRPTNNSGNEGDDDAMQGDNDASENSVSYIAPDRVIARLDVHAVANKKEQVFAKHDPVEKQPLKASGRESVFNWSRGQVASKRPLGVATGNSAPSSAANKARSKDGKVDTKKVAAQFFQKAQAKLSGRDLASLKKSIVDMKRFGDQKDEASYLRAAKEVLTLCGRAEEVFGDQHEETMIALFFHLVAKPFRRKVELMGMQVLYKESALKQLCKENLRPENLNMCSDVLPKFLHALWCACGETDGIASNKTQFLKEVQKMLLILLEPQDSVSSRMVEAFIKLVPSRFAAATHALAAEIKASRNISCIKANEAARAGEDAINATRFQTSRPAHGTTVKIESIVSGAVPTKKPVRQIDARAEQPKIIIAAIKGPGINNKEATAGKFTATSTAKTVQPFGDKSKSLSSLLDRAKTSSQRDDASAREKPRAATTKQASTSERRGAPPSYSRHSNNLSKLTNIVPPSKNKPLHSKAANKDLVSKMLREAESQPFVKKTTGDIVRALGSNIPSNASCSVCISTAQNPMIGDCGHLACKSCWLQWLEKHSSCPICRRDVAKMSLARVVFRDGERPSNPSLSQLCGPSDDTA